MCIVDGNEVLIDIVQLLEENSKIRARNSELERIIEQFKRKNKALYSRSEELESEIERQDEKYHAELIDKERIIKWQKTWYTNRLIKQKEKCENVVSQSLNYMIEKTRTSKNLFERYFAYRFYMKLKSGWDNR